jgi:transposase
MSGDGFSRRYTMVAETRRRWGDAEKQAIVAEAARPGTNISAVARRHGIKPSLLFRWRRMAQAAAETQSAGAVFLPVAVTNGKASDEDAASGELPPASDAAAHCLADSRIEIELGNGRLVRVGAGVDIGALKRVLNLLDSLATTGAAPRRKRFS